MKKYLYSLICFWILFSCSSDTPSNGNENNNENGGNKQPQIEKNESLSNFTTDGGSNVVKFTTSEA